MDMPTLGTLLRSWRERALLTQELLAERAGLSVRTIRRLEGGDQRRPRCASLHLLAEALSLDGAEREVLIAASRDVPPFSGTARQLPPGAAHFIGRDKELAALDGILRERRTAALTVVAIVGAAGIGKTSLAIHWCSSVACEFPGGQLYLNLRGFGQLAPLDPLDALHTLLRGLGVEQIPDDLAAASALFRSRTEGSRMLVLLDNARSSEQVRPLLPARGCVAVVTSRNQLRSLTAREATARVAVPPLQPSESVALLNRVSGRPTWLDPAVRRLAELCGNSPLPLRIIGERLGREPGAGLADLADEIENVWLAAFSGEDASSDLRTVLSWSYASLDGDAARMLRVLGGLGPGAVFGPGTASVLSGVPVEQARHHLDSLVATHLVEQQRDGRYYLHDLVRAYVRGVPGNG